MLGYSPARANVADGSITSILTHPGDVRFTPGIDRIADIPERQFRASRRPGGLVSLRIRKSVARGDKYTHSVHFRFKNQRE